MKYAALQGKLVVLSQTERVNESFYDLFNQNFSKIESDDSIRYYANIAVGSISKPCLVDLNFQCIVHMRLSELEHVPAAFLNRFEKYRLSQLDLLQCRSRNLNDDISVIFQAAFQKARELEDVMGVKSFYGAVSEQTIGSIFLDLLSFNDTVSSAVETSGEMVGQPPPENFCTMEQLRSYIKQHGLPVNTTGKGRTKAIILKDVARLAVSNEGVLQDIQNASKGTWTDSAMEAFGDHFSSTDPRFSGLMKQIGFCIRPSVLLDARCISDTVLQQVPLTQDMTLTQGMTLAQDTGISDGNDCRSRESDIAACYIYNTLLQYAVSRLLQLATPEAVYCNRAKLPASVVRLYFQQEHFSLKRLLTQICGDDGSHIIYTRTTGAIHRLPSFSSDTSRAFPGSEDVLRESVFDDPSRVVVHRLSQFNNETSFLAALEGWASHPTRTIFLMLVDMNIATLNAINFVRLKIEQLGTLKTKSAVLLLHFPQSNSRVQTYPTLFLSGWEHHFLDGLGSNGGGNFSLDITEWCEIACGAKTSWDAFPVLLKRLPHVLGTVASRLPRVGSNFDCVKALLLDRKNGVIGEILCAKFAAVWNSEVICEEIDRASHALCSGVSSLSLQQSMGNVLDSVFVNFLAWLVTKIVMGMVEDSEYVPKVEALAFGIIERFPTRPVDELKCLNHSYAGLIMPSTPNLFPFHNVICSTVEDLLDDALSDIEVEISPTSSHRMKTWNENAAMEHMSTAVNMQRDNVTYALMSWVDDQVRLDDELWDRYIDQLTTFRTGLDSKWQRLLVRNWIRDRENGLSRSLFRLHVSFRKHHIALGRWTSSLEPLSEIVDTVGGLPDALLPKEITPAGRPLLLGLELLSCLLKKGIADEHFLRLRNWDSAFRVFQQHLPSLLLSDGSPTDNAFVITQVDMFAVCSSAVQSVTGVDAILAICAASLQCIDPTDHLSRGMRLLSKSTAAQEKLIRWFISPWRRLFRVENVNDASTCTVFLSFVEDTTYHEGLRIALLKKMLTSMPSLNGLGFSDRFIASFDEHCRGKALRSTSNVDKFQPAWLTLNGRDSTLTNGTLADVCFSVVLRKTLEDCHGQPCAQLALVYEGLRKNNEKGGGLFRKIHLTSVAIAFLAMLAHELSSDLTGSLGSRSAVNALHILMQEEPQIPWAHFLFGMVIVNSSTAKLYQVLKMSSLSSFSWCAPWVQALPSASGDGFDGQENAVQNAQKLFEEAQKDEQWKSQHCKLCPHCSAVVQLIEGCTAMTCGRDQHGGNQQHGCGKAFSWTSAPLYVIKDISARVVVEREVEKLEMMTTSKKLWDDLRDFSRSIPVLQVSVEQLESPIVKVASLMEFLVRESACSDAITQEMNRTVMRFLELRHELRRMHILPDLIEFYQWVHSNLGHLLTRKRALECSVGEIINMRTLSRRFDPAHSRHVVLLWDRVMTGYNDFIESQGGHLRAGACGRENTTPNISNETKLMHLLTTDKDSEAGEKQLGMECKTVSFSPAPVLCVDTTA